MVNCGRQAKKVIQVRQALRVRWEKQALPARRVHQARPVPQGRPAPLDRRAPLRLLLMMRPAVLARQCAFCGRLAALRTASPSAAVMKCSLLHTAAAEELPLFFRANDPPPVGRGAQQATHSSRSVRNKPSDNRIGPSSGVEGMRSSVKRTPSARAGSRHRCCGSAAERRRRQMLEFRLEKPA